MRRAKPARECPTVSTPSHRRYPFAIELFGRYRWQPRMLVLVCVACALTLNTPVSSNAAVDLRVALLPAIEVGPTAHVASETTLTAASIYDDSGALGDLKRANVVGGVARRYALDRASVAIMLVEYRDSDWASDPVQNLMDTDAPDMGDGVRLFRGVRQGRYVEAASCAQGRVNIQVWAASVDGTGTGIHELVSRVLQSQRARVPALPDLQKSADSPTSLLGKRLANQMGAAAASILLAFAALGQVIATTRDRGSREWSVHRWFNTHQLPAGTRVFDVTTAVRRRGRWQTVLWSLKTIGTAALLGFLIAWPGLSLWAGLALFAALYTVCSITAMLMSQNRSYSAEAQGTAASVVLGIGGMISGLAIAAGVMLTAGALAGWIMLQRLAALPIVVPMALCGLAMINDSRRPIRFARRVLQPLVRQQIADDGRDPVLLLRSFEDDALEVRVPTARDFVAHAFAGDVYSRFEELVAWRSWSIGPVLTYGQPGTVLQPLGAARSYHDDDGWQDAIARDAETARAIVLVVGRSPGLYWEIEDICERGLLAKAIFVLPPVPPTEARMRTQVLAAALELDVATLDAGPHRLPLVLRFEGDGRPVLYVSGGRTGPAYDEALRLAQSDVPTLVPWLSSPACDVAGPKLDVADLLVGFDPSSVSAPRRSVITVLADVALNFVPL